MKPFAWSYSSLTAFETCPRRYYATKVSKEFQEPQTEASLWGNRVHKALELRLTKQQPLPENMKDYEPLAAALIRRSQGGALKAETKLALNRNLQPTNWFSDDVWVRGITDFTIEYPKQQVIGDWKTGKPLPDSAQMRLTAAMTYAIKPYLERIVNVFVWLKTGAISPPEECRPNDVPRIWNEFYPRVARMEQALAENKFPAKPGGLCRNYCPCTNCEYNGR